MDDKIQDAGREFIVSLRKYLPNAVLIDDQIKSDAIQIKVGIFCFEIEIYPSGVLLYKKFVFSFKSEYILEKTKQISFELACQDIKEFLVEQQTAIAKTLGE